jgi:hypothetical protein
MQSHPTQITGDRRRPCGRSLSSAIRLFALCRFLPALAVALAVIAAIPLPASAQTTPTAPASITGIVLDSAGAPVAGADVTLSTNSLTQTAITAGDGAFRFTQAPPGDFTLKISSEGLGEQIQHGALNPGQTLTLPPIAMRLTRVMAEVDVLPSDQISHLQVQEEEKQRLLGFIPNFYVVYDRNPAPMTARSKYQLAWRNFVDPVNIGIVAAGAGVAQADGSFSGFGPGPAGYGKRFGAGLADFTIGSFLTSAILPQVFKQDPRYFYDGIGTVSSRTGYAISRAVVCKGDNSKWQPCYSNLVGEFGSAAASNLYYPAINRRGPALTMENASLSIGYDALGNLIQEFLLKRITPASHNHGADLP